MTICLLWISTWVHNKHLRHNSTESKLWYLPTNLFLPETSPQQMATSLQLFKTLEIIFLKISYTSQQPLSNFCWLLFSDTIQTFTSIAATLIQVNDPTFCCTCCDSLSSFSSYSFPFSSFPGTTLPYPTLLFSFSTFFPFALFCFLFSISLLIKDRSINWQISDHVFQPFTQNLSS